MRSLGGATNQFLWANNALIRPPVPFTVSCWCIAPNVVPALPWFSHAGGVIFQFDQADLLMHNGAWIVSPGDVLQNNVLHHVCGIFDGGGSVGYRNGTQVISGNTGAAAPSGNVYIGARDYAGNSYLVGNIGEVAVWGVTLTVGEVRALARGVSPRIIRPLALKGYWPLWGASAPEPDLSPSKVPMALQTGGSIPRADHKCAASPMAL